MAQVGACVGLVVEALVVVVVGTGWLRYGCVVAHFGGVDMQAAGLAVQVG